MFHEWLIDYLKDSKSNPIFSTFKKGNRSQGFSNFSIYCFNKKNSYTIANGVVNM